MIEIIKKNAFARNSLILFIGTMIANVLNYIFHLVVGRMVSVPMYGEIESLLSLVHIVSVPGLTLTLVATKYAAGTKADDDPAGSRAILKYMSKKLLLYGTPIFVLSLFLVPFVGDFLKIESSLPLLLIWVSMFILFFSSINDGIINGWQKFFGGSAVNIAGTLVKLVAAVVLIKIGFGVNGAIGGYTLSALAVYIGTLFVLKFIFVGDSSKKNEKNFVDFGSLKKYILPAFIATLAVAMLGNVDMVMAKHQLDLQQAGYYGALTIMSKAIFFATGAIATVLFAMSSEESYKKADTLKIFRYSIILTFLVTFFSAIFYGLFPEFVINIFFGEKYLLTADLLIWFAIMASLYAFANLFIQYLLSIHKTETVWTFLILSILVATALFFWGKSIRDIILIVSITQIVVILVGLMYIFGKKNTRTTFN